MRIFKGLETVKIISGGGDTVKFLRTCFCFPICSLVFTCGLNQDGESGSCLLSPFTPWNMTGCPQNRAINIRRKGTASVILSDPPCKDDNVRFKRITLKALSDQVWTRYQCLCFWKLILFTCGFSQESIYELSNHKTFKTRKTTISFTLLVLRVPF